MASAIDMAAIKKNIAQQNEFVAAEGTDQVDKPLIVVVNNQNATGGKGQFSMGNNNTVDPNHTKKKEFKKQSTEECSAFCDFMFCSFHCCSSCLIILFILIGFIHIGVSNVLLSIKCSDDNLHDLDDPLVANFPYPCHDFHYLLKLQLWDGVFCVSVSLIAIIALITLKPKLLIPIIAYGAINVVYQIVLIFLYPDFVNVFAIGSVLLSIGYSLVFYKTYKIMKKVNYEWPTIEMMKPASQTL